MAIIRAIRAGETVDSRGDATVEVEIETGGTKATAASPSGGAAGREDRQASSGVAYIETKIAPGLIGRTFDQQGIDAYLIELGIDAHTAFAVSAAFARAEARERGVPLYRHLAALGSLDPAVPHPLFNVLNGGRLAKSGIEFQECLVVPEGFATIAEQVAAATACMAALQPLLGFGIDMGDEGGFAPSLASNTEALDLLVAATKNAGYTTEEIALAVDACAVTFYKDGMYAVRENGGVAEKSAAEMLAWYEALVSAYPLIALEDPFASDDRDSFRVLTKKRGDRLLVVSDVPTSTDAHRIAQAAEEGIANACIVKPDQNGTVTGAVSAVLAARGAGWKVIASHRAGETMDTFIADFAAGLACDYLKAGAPTKEERMVKYNRLMDIEKEMGA